MCARTLNMLILHSIKTVQLRYADFCAAAAPVAVNELVMTTRNVPLDANKSALLIIDMQNYCAKPGRGLFAHIKAVSIPQEHRYMFDRIDNTVVPSIRNLLSVFRSKRPQTNIIYTYIECLTHDGRDQSLDYKLSGFLVPKGSDDAQIISELKPHDDDIMIPKTSCSVFNSTNIEYVLRNLGVSQLVVTGMVTNQCVESAVRDAADRGFLVTLIEDAVATHTPEDHAQSLKNMRGFARICSHQQVLEEVTQWK